MGNRLTGFMLDGCVQFHGKLCHSTWWVTGRREVVDVLKSSVGVAEPQEVGPGWFAAACPQIS
jgi:hypothetical protein